MPITIDLTGEDWEPTGATKFFAQRDGGKFAFGATEAEALANLLAEEATAQHLLNEGIIQ